MSFPITDALTLIRDLLAHLHDETPLFASPEDAAYFRKTYTPPKPAAPLPSFVPVPDLPPSSFVPVCTPDLPTPSPPFVPAPAPDFSPPPDSLRSLLKKIAPEATILDEIPNDALARKVANRWKTKNQTAPITLLSFSEPPEQKKLLEEIAKALDVYFGPAHLIQAEPIEKEKQWEALLSVADLKWIIACDYTLWQLPALMPFYKENPTQGVRTLGKIPLFLLPDLSLYLKEPLLKRSLWKALCQKLSS